jgi:two-component system response regulator HydG
VTKRIAGGLVLRLARVLEREEREALARRFVRVERSLRERATEAESALVSARRMLTHTQAFLDESKGFGEMVGTSASMKTLYDSIRRWGPTEETVLVTGESGTGKELVARALHGTSRRGDGPFFAVNCAALAESLLESELFGHEKGAFTGADEQRPGLFELAGGGTLVLDEVADTSPAMQARLLRVLEERKIRRVGGTSSLPVDVRVLALSNRPLDREVRAGRFREDLYHRLDVAEIPVPPLRERKEDIPPLAEHFLASMRGEGEQAKLSRRVTALLMRYHWPGNVRELRNLVQRAAVLARGRALKPRDFQGLGEKAVSRTSLSETLLARLREATASAGLELEARHEDLIRALAAGGNIRRAEYEKMTGVSTRTAARDLERFVSLGLVQKQGRGRGTYYTLPEM